MPHDGENAPFILRFSKSMYRENPVKPRGGKPRDSATEAPDKNRLAAELRSGYSRYRSFSHNEGLPIYFTLRMKPEAQSKSLRYHFIKNTDISLCASLAHGELVFSLSDSQHLSKMCSVITHSRNSAFRSSMSHISSIASITPEVKIQSSLIPEDKRIILRTFRHGDYSGLVRFLRDDINQPDIRLFKAGSESCISLTLTDCYKLEKIMTHSLARSAEPQPEIIVSPRYLRHEALPLECIIPRDFDLDYPKAAVVDTGVAEGSFLREWELGRESYVDRQGTAHGTFTTGRLLQRGESFGGITFLDAQLIPADGQLGWDQFYANLRELLSKHHNSIKIYNISLGTDIEVSDKYSLPAQMLDELQREFGVLFILSAGNKPPHQTTGRITSPAESVHSVTVGSAAHTDTNIQHRLSPSLFTRHGPAPCGFIKPDIASFGGAHESRFGRLRDIGVFSIGINNELAEDTGTSHAAPLVTAIAAKTYHRYSHASKDTHLTKALLIHEAFRGNTDRISDIYKGFGILPSEKDDTSVTYLHRGVMKPDMIVELSDIPVPPDMFEDDRLYGEICITLVYTTPTDSAFPHYHCMYRLDISFGYYSDGKWRSIITKKNSVGAPVDKDEREQFYWQPVKVLRRELRGINAPESLSLRIIASKRDFYKQKEQIPYAFVISFRHSEKNLYQSLRNQNSKYEDILEPAYELWKTCG